MARNPFVTGAYRLAGVEHESQAVDVETRLQMVKQFTEEQLLAALELEGLQKSVRGAVERRLRKLGTAIT